MSDFFQMGGHAAYVWSAYGITLLVLIFNVWSAKRMRQQNIDRARRSTGRDDPARAPTVREL